MSFLAAILWSVVAWFGVVLGATCHAKHHDVPLDDDVPFGPPHHNDLDGIRRHFERLIAAEEQAA